MPAIVTTKSNAYSLWDKGLIAATNAPFNTNFATTPSSAATYAATLTGASGGYEDVLGNIALKGGFNAIRVFLPIGEYRNASNVIVNDVQILAAAGITGWNSTAVRNTYDNNQIPTLEIIAAQITNLLNLCQERGIGVIFCLQSYYQGVAGNLWASQSLQNDLATFWKIFAQKWKMHPALIAYEILNEPSPGRASTWPNYTNMRLSTNLNNFTKLMNECVTAIRSTTTGAGDATTPIIVSSINGSDLAGFDYFFDSANAGTNLVQGTSIVYTGHFYGPFRYTHQGIYEGSYHSLGVCYPNIKSTEETFPDSATSYQYETYDFLDTTVATGGLEKAFKNAAFFKNTYQKPVFLGEFSAASTTYLKLLSGSTNGASDYVPPNSPARAVVGLNYDSTTNEGVLILKGPIRIYDLHTIGGVRRQRNIVQLQIESYGGSNISSFATTVSNVTLQGDTYVGTGDENFYIRFPWTGSIPAQPSIGLSHKKADGSFKSSQEIRDYFASLGGVAPTQYASIKILVPDTVVTSQEASRVTFARDVLRMCSKYQFSWAWQFDYNIKNSQSWGDKFWQIDNIVNAVTGVGGKLRALLKRAAHQSYE